MSTNINKRSKKIIKRNQFATTFQKASFLEEKLRMVEKYCLKQMAVPTCPVTLERYDFKNPPFQTNTCQHSISLEALKNLTIYTIEIENKKVKSMQCPLCRTSFHFASLNLMFFTYWNLYSQIKIDDAHTENIISTEEVSRNLRRLPRFFSPQGGCLADLKTVTLN